MRRWYLPLAVALLFLAAGLTAWWLPEGPELQTGAPAPAGSVSERKEAFIEDLLPHIRAENERVREQRERVKQAHERLRKGRTLSAGERDWLLRVARRYRLAAPENDRPDEQWIRQLLERVDVVPADLALAQAALESAWGQSRFVRRGNNYFGHWCFTEGCGMVPQRRSEGATHEVQVFDSAAGSVKTYIHNLNSHPAYTRMRRIRAELRARNRPLRGAHLAIGLEKYSGIGHTYADRISSMIDYNDLERFRQDD